MIKKDYIDDGISGGSDQDVCRLIGEVTLKDGSLEYCGTVAQIMERGSFFIKYMVQDSIKLRQPSTIDCALFWRSRLRRTES